MAAENGRPWYRDPRIIIMAVVVILAAIITPIVAYNINKPPPDFGMSVNPITGKTHPGGALQTLVTIEDIQGYKYQVILEASEQPRGVVVTFIPIGGPTPPYSSTMTINVAPDVPVGDYTIIVRGTGADGKEHTCKYVITVISPPRTPNFNISVNPMQGEVDQGEVIETTVTVNSIQGYEHPISLSATGQPSNILIAFIPPTGEPTPVYASTMTINVAPDVPVGDYTIIVKGTGTDGKEHTCTYTLSTVESRPIPTPTTINIEYEGGAQFTGRISGHGLKPESEYMLTLNGKAGQVGNEALLRDFATKDDEGVYDFMRIRTDARGDVSAGFTAKDLPSGRYDVTFLVKETLGDWKPVYTKDHVVFTITPPPSLLEITYPPSDGRVDIKEIVRGTSKSIPEEKVIWIAIYPHEVSRYYPQDLPADVQVNGDWSSSIFIGIEADVDKKFDIIAVLLNKEAQDAFNDYLEECEEKKSWPGLEELPSGADIYDRITVIRR